MPSLARSPKPAIRPSDRYPVYSNGAYLTPSERDEETVYVTDPERSTCTCPAYEWSGGVGCKHLKKFSKTYQLLERLRRSSRV